MSKSKYDRLPIEDQALILSVVDALIEALENIKNQDDKIIDMFTNNEFLQSFKGNPSGLNRVYQIFLDRSEVLECYELCSILKKLQETIISKL